MVVGLVSSEVFLATSVCSLLTVKLYTIFTVACYARRTCPSTALLLLVLCGVYESKSTVLVPGLQNNLSWIHPTLLYYVYFGAHLLAVRQQALYLTYAIFLGGWWAAQEVNWGGWWNWDFIEVPVLTLWGVFLYNLHNRLRKKKSLAVIRIIIAILAAVMFSRFFVSTSIHAFTGLSNFVHLWPTLTLFLLVITNTSSMTSLVFIIGLAAQLLSSKVIFGKVVVGFIMLFAVYQNKPYYRLVRLRVTTQHKAISLGALFFSVVNYKNNMFVVNGPGIAGTTHLYPQTLATFGKGGIYGVCKDNLAANFFCYKNLIWVKRVLSWDGFFINTLTFNKTYIH